VPFFAAGAEKSWPIVAGFVLLFLVIGLDELGYHSVYVVFIWAYVIFGLVFLVLALENIFGPKRR